MPSTSPSDERTCDTTTLLRHYLCLSTWFLTALSYSPSQPPRLCQRLPHPLVHLLRRPLSFCSSSTSPRPQRLLGELSTPAVSDFSVLPAVPETFPILRFPIAIRFPKNLQKFVRYCMPRDARPKFQFFFLSNVSDRQRKHFRPNPQITC